LTSSGTSRSSLSSESRQTPLSTKRNISIGNGSTQLSLEATQLSQRLNTSIG
jgi:hypothetical protein